MRTNNSEIIKHTLKQNELLNDIKASFGYKRKKHYNTQLLLIIKGVLKKYNFNIKR